MSEDLQQQLYDRFANEQEAYRKHLLSMTPEAMLEHSYEYTVREDLLAVMENKALCPEQAAALLESGVTFADLYKDFMKIETGYMDILRDTVKNRAESTLQKAAELRNMPVYRQTGEYAREHDELDTYRKSYRANIACKEAIEKSIRENYDGIHLDNRAVKKVTDAFGYDRTFYVLATTVRQKNWDARISDDNKTWAVTISVCPNPDGFGGDRNTRFVVDQAHPGLINLFTQMARREYLLSLPLTKEEIRQEALNLLSQFQNAREPNSPSGTHYMAQVSQDFLRRAGDKDQDRLMNLLPFPSLSLSALEGRKGIYALISKDENRFQKLGARRNSVLKKLRDAQEETKTAPASKRAKSRGTER